MLKRLQEEKNFLKNGKNPKNLNIKRNAYYLIAVIPITSIPTSILSLIPRWNVYGLNSKVYPVTTHMPF